MSQPVNAALARESPQQEDLSGPPAANRHRLPDERVGLTHHFSIAGHEGYLTVGLYPNGQPGEIFIRMAKEGSTIAGLMECFGTVVSVSLQHGVPLKVICDKLSHTRFEPSGWTGNGELGYRQIYSARSPENGTHRRRLADFPLPILVLDGAQARPHRVMCFISEA
jgi:ribonucleoside-diphosphate reductase alpha chain